jgi:hypothetical protein
MWLNYVPAILLIISNTLLKLRVYRVSNRGAVRLNTPVWYGSIGVLDHTSKKTAFVKRIHGHRQ